jgi:hypothetical protein
MTLNEFNLMDEMEQIETVWNKGVRLAERKTEEQLFELYQIDGFYVELGGPLDAIGYNHILVAETTDLLTPYLDQIQLPE